MTDPRTLARQLFVAANNGHRNACEAVLSLGLDVNTTDDQGATALMKAANMGHTNVCRYLLDQGAHLEGQDQNGHRPLHYAASGGEQAVCQLLVERGARFDRQDNQGATPLDYAGSPESSAYLESLEQAAQLERDTALIEDTFNPCGDTRALEAHFAGGVGQEYDQTPPRKARMRL